MARVCDFRGFWRFEWLEVPKEVFEGSGFPRGSKALGSERFYISAKGFAVFEGPKGSHPPGLPSVQARVRTGF